MATNVPSFVKRSAGYEDIFWEEESGASPTAAVPLSQVRTSSTGHKRKLPAPAIESAKTSTPHSSKRVKSHQASGKSSGSLHQKFSAMISHHIPERDIAEWEKVEIADANQAALHVAAQSFYHLLNHCDQMAEARRFNQKLSEEIQELKAALQGKDSDVKKLADVNRKLKASEAKLLKERAQLSSQVVNLDVEKADLIAAHALKIQELDAKMETLNLTLANEKSSARADKKAKYNAGYSNGINDYIRSTYAAFPDLEWAKLGEDAVDAIEKIKEEEAKARKHKEPASADQMIEAVVKDVNQEVPAVDAVTTEPEPVATPPSDATKVPTP